MIALSGLDRPRSIIVQGPTHKVFEELKDTTLWVRTFVEYELKDSREQKCPRSTRRNGKMMGVNGGMSYHFLPPFVR